MGTEGVGEVCDKCNTRSIKGENEVSWYHKGHDIGIITRAFFNLQRKVPSGYIVVGYLLFLLEQIKGIII